MGTLVIALTLGIATAAVFAQGKNPVTSANSSTQSAVQEPDTYQFTPLVVAAVSGNAEVVRDLIERGVDVNGCDARGNFPLYAAVIGDHAEVVELLIKKGANVNQAKAANVPPVMERNTTALHAASGLGNQRVVELLISAGADVNAFANINEEGARIAKSRADSARLTEASRARLRDRQREIGVTPLTQASKFGHANIVKLLLEHGADVNFQKPGNNTALIEAAIAGKRDVIELLLSSKADPNRKGSFGTALAYALINEQYDSAKVLLAAGADFQLTTKTPEEDMSMQHFAWGIYQALVADKLTPQSRSVEAREKFTEALASLTAARDELNKKAETLNKLADESDKLSDKADKLSDKADKDAHKADRFASWIPVLDIISGAAGAALTDYSQRSAQRQMAQISALRNSKTPNEYFANYEKVEGESRPISSPVAPGDSIITDRRSNVGDSALVHGAAQSMRNSAQLDRKIAQISRETAQLDREMAQSYLRKAATCDYLVGRVMKILNDGTGK
jgi:ankyrin repeat protein/predicted  nucleic acid-binding Zn-ribbon protein